jgi:hypothetical protein
MKNNILLYYTTIPTAILIIDGMSIKMSFLKDSKDTFEVWFPAQKYADTNAQSAFDVESIQIACFQKAYFNICGNKRGDKDHMACHFNNPTKTIISPIMEYTYGNFGEGICFILDKEKFEQENSIFEYRDIKYVEDNFQKSWAKQNELLNSSLTACDKFKINMDALSFKNSSFVHENEQRFFSQGNKENFLSIKNSLIGACIGKRVSNVQCKHYVDIGTFCCLYETFMKRVKTNNIDLFQTDDKFYLIQLNKDDPDVFRWRYVHCFGVPYFEDDKYWISR